MGGGLSLNDQSDDVLVSQEHLSSLISPNELDEGVFSIIAGENKDLVSYGDLKKYILLLDVPLILHFIAVKSLWFTAAHGGRGRGLVEIKDTVAACESIFRALFTRFTSNIQCGMTVAEFNRFVLVSGCGLDENAVNSNFYECTEYPEDEDNVGEVSKIRADCGRFASAVIRIANACDLEATGESDKTLREQLLGWLSSCSLHLGISHDAVLATQSPSLLRSESFFSPPPNFQQGPHPVVFLEISIDDSVVGRIILELKSSVAPKTSYNFLCLCTGERGTGEVTGVPLCFRGCAFHRVVTSLCIQGGDLEGSDGYGGESVYGGEFDDECSTLKHDDSGVLSMGNQGPNTNTSQFFITVCAAPHLDGENCVFGNVVSGMDVVLQLGSVAVDDEDRPTCVCVISDCGEVV